MRKTIFALALFTVILSYSISKAELFLEDTELVEYEELATASTKTTASETKTGDNTTKTNTNTTKSTNGTTTKTNTTKTCKKGDKKC